MSLNYKNQDLHEYFCYSQEDKTDQADTGSIKNNARHSQKPHHNQLLPEIPPPTVATATLDLIKHLQLYLELKRLFPLDTNNSASIVTTARRKHLPITQPNNNIITQNQQLNDDKEANLFIDDDSDCEIKIETTPTRRRANNCLDSETNNNHKNEAAVTVEDDTDDDFDDEFYDAYEDEDFFEQKNNNETTGNDDDDPTRLAERLRPAIPYYFYSDTFSSFVNDEPYVGREWLFREIERALDSSPVVVLAGQSGCGKTKLVHHLFKLSSVHQNTQLLNSSAISATASASMQVKYLASSLAAVHTCLPDDKRTHSTRQFLHTLAWSLQHFDPLNKVVDTGREQQQETVNLYAQCLTENGAGLLRKLLTKQRLFSNNTSSSLTGSTDTQEHNESASSGVLNTSNLDAAASPIATQTIDYYSQPEGFMSNLLDTGAMLRQCIVEPVSSLLATHTVKFNYMYVVIDGLDFFEDNDDDCDDGTIIRVKKPNNIRRFLLDLLSGDLCPSLPKWLKFLVTVRDEKCVRRLKDLCHVIRLDTNSGGLSSSNFNLTKDLSDYIAFRIGKSVDIQKNVLCLTLNSQSSAMMQVTAAVVVPAAAQFDVNFQNKFMQHLVRLSGGNFLFLRLLLDLIERGMMVIKSANFNVIPKDFTHLLKL
jgi:energy-coupling factor transporter ATP-binding protein EcfA2